MKGPELLNKYVGETERQIREIFQRAKERSEEGLPVIVFFDEMDSIFRTRGTGISSDVESTIVPQLLSELDGVETLKNVIVIGASNREDLIDPAILRPGRLDVKIKIERPNQQQAADIMSKYLHPVVPIHPDEVGRYGGDAQQACFRMIEKTVEQMYEQNDRNRFLEVTYASGDKEILYFKDFNSGAMIENIVRRAKKDAIKRFLSTGEKGIKTEDLLTAIRDEFKENEDLPEHHEPRRLGAHLGQEGRAHRVRPHAARRRRRRPAGRARERRPVPVRWPRGHRQGLRDRDGVRHRRGRGARLQPRAVVVPADLDLRRVAPPHPVGLRAGVAAARRARVRAGAGPRGQRRGPRPGERDPAQRRPLLRRPRAPRVLHAGVHHAARASWCTTRRGSASWNGRSREVATAMPSAPQLAIYKNNSDGKGNSYGTHENYLVDRATPFGDIVRDLTPFFVSRSVFTGAGKVGAEAPWDERDRPVYQLTQRADFFETEVGLETTLKRPIINTRDEPHADPERYRRLHVIVGDANLCEVATFLKIGTTAIVLKMIEDRVPAGPVDRAPRAGAARDVS